jgi:3'-5' exonuclease
MDLRKLSKNILFIDIETVSGYEAYQQQPVRMQKLWDYKASFLKNDDSLSSDELYFDRAGIFAEFGKVIVIGLGFVFWQNDQPHLKVKTLASHNETELLTEFKTLLEQSFKNKNLMLCAHNGKEFDFPYLCRRMLVNGIDLPNALDIGNKKPWEIPHLDTLELWKFGDRKHYTSLDLMAAVFDIESSKSELTGNQVNHTYYKNQDLDLIRRYCLDDVIVLTQIFFKLNGYNSIPAANIERNT